MTSEEWKGKTWVSLAGGGVCDHNLALLSS